jgi:large subunit ribosomal protein L24
MRSMMGGKKSRPSLKGKLKVHVRRGDRVRIIRGNDAGSEGTVIRVVPERNQVVVEGINRRTKHVRPTQENPEGGRITFDAPIDASKVMLIDPTSGEPSRARKSIARDGSKERIAVRSGNPIPKTER